MSRGSIVYRAHFRGRIYQVRVVRTGERSYAHALVDGVPVGRRYFVDTESAYDPDPQFGRPLLNYCIAAAKGDVAAHSSRGLSGFPAMVEA